MTTLALRLAGPLQAWAAHSRGIRRPTHRAPTYSGLSGLIAAALGRPRSDATDPLAEATIAVRIDKPPRVITDYQSINTLPSPGDRFVRQRQRRPQMLTMAGGPYNETVLTYRQYLADGQFVCLVESTDADRFATALTTPRWATFLGRKACVPGIDIVLGTFDTPAADLIGQLPVIDSHANGATVTREVHWLSNSPTAAAAAADVEWWVDQPAGPVGAAYHGRPRTTAWQTCPTVTSSRELRQWSVDHRLSDRSAR